MKIIPFRRVYEDMGNSRQSRYLNRYLTALGAKTVVVEDNYIDKDYLLDYSYFYARSFEPHSRFTTRLHFFSEVFSEKDFKKLFDLDKDIQSLLENSYLGFVVVKPITDPEQQNEPFIGRTVLKTYPKDDGDEHRRFLINSYSASLFGFPLTIKSLPYQTHSPFEITQTSVSFPGLDRNFPSSGLNIFQMKDYFNSIGMDTESINVENAPLDVQKYIVSDDVKAYLGLGLPLIACIQLKKNNRVPELHAVVVSGYRYDNNSNLKELYVHDDQIGTYSKVSSRNDDGDFSHWVNEWVTVYGYEDVFVEKLLIPIYPKIRLSFNSIYKTLLDIKEAGYKADLLLKELTKPFPRFLWVIRIGDRESPGLDILFDAISLNKNPFQVIIFD